ncbi:hypothetical protein [Actinoplanes sp. G11-F43]|uniref:hypothetical protein n=1 Tax=Actinoplanes sp. G11-F43 TaxID=3424130 RepID=UPI003D340303
MPTRRRDAILSDDGRTTVRVQEFTPDESRRAGLTTLWRMSTTAAHGHQPTGAAGPLLDLAAVLDSNGIPVELFTGPAVREAVAGRRGRETSVDDILDGIACLRRFSLARLTDGPRRVLRVHQLLQRTVREGDPARCLASAQTAADALEAFWPDDEHDRGLGQLLRVNVDAVWGAHPDAMWGGNLHQVVFRAGNSFYRDGLFAEAVVYWTDLRREAESRLGPDYQDTLNI